jgi:hypothetical protein
MARTMPDMDSWLEPFLVELGHKKRQLQAPLHLCGLLGLSERKACSRLRRVRGCLTMINCSTSSPAQLGTTAHFGG